MAFRVRCAGETGWCGAPLAAGWARNSAGSLTGRGCSAGLRARVAGLLRRGVLPAARAGAVLALTGRAEASAGWFSSSFSAVAVTGLRVRRRAVESTASCAKRAPRFVGGGGKGMDLDAQMTREARKVQGRAQAAERGANEKAAKVAKAASIR